MDEMEATRKAVLENLVPWADAAPDEEVPGMGGEGRITRRGVVLEIEGDTPRGRRWVANVHRLNIWHERLQRSPMPMTMYLTANCPHHPIVAMEVEPCGLDGYRGCVRMAGIIPPGCKPELGKHFIVIYRPGMDCFPTLDEAVSDAERRRAKAVAKLQEEMVKLQSEINRYNAIDFRR